MQNRQDKQNRELTAQRGVVDDNDGNYLANTISERGDMCCSGAASLLSPPPLQTNCLLENARVRLLLCFMFVALNRLQFICQ